MIKNYLYRDGLWFTKIGLTYVCRKRLSFCTKLALVFWRNSKVNLCSFSCFLDFVRFAFYFGILSLHKP